MAHHKTCVRIHVGYGRKCCSLLASLIAIGVLTTGSTAQMVNVGTPFQNVGDSFYENFGTSGSYANNDGTFSFNWGGGNAIPPFGGYNPNNDATLGFRRGGFSLNLRASQGSSRTNSVTTPSVTMMNGGTGSIINSSFRPFVTSVVPVIGNGGNNYVPVVSGYPSFQMNPASQVVYINPLAEKIQRLRTESPEESPRLRELRERAKAEQRAKSLDVAPPVSSASYGDLSVAEIKAAQANEADTVSPKVAESIAKADKYAREDKLGLAKYHYKYALKRAPESHKSQLSEKLAAVEQRIYEQKREASAKP